MLLEEPVSSQDMLVGVLWYPSCFGCAEIPVSLARRACVLGVGVIGLDFGIEVVNLGAKRSLTEPVVNVPNEVAFGRLPPVNVMYTGLVLGA